jgi:hypothetical protein
MRLWPWQAPDCTHSRQPRVQASKQQITRTVGMAWAVGWLAEAAWQFAFVRKTFVLSAILLVVACGAFQAALRQSYGIAGLPAWSRNLIIGITSVNAAWLSVATVVGIVIAIRVTAPAATVPISIIGAILITAYGVHVSLSRRDAAYCATLAWALLAVFVKQRGHHNSVAWTAAAAALAAGTAAILAFVPDSDVARAATDAEQQVHEALTGEP